MARTLTLFVVLVVGCTADVAPTDEEAYDGEPLRYVTASIRSFPSGGGNGRIEVVVPTGEAWSATGDGFISITRGSGVGTGTVEYTLPRNDGPYRLGQIRVAGRTVVVMQGGYVPDPFEDVPTYADHAAYVYLMRDLGITRGCAGPPVPRFCADAAATRGQVAVFIVRALQVRAGLGPDAFDFRASPFFPADVPIGHPFFAHVQELRERDITRGCGSDRFCVDDAVTAGAMAAFVVRAQNGETFEHPATPYFGDVPASHPFFRYVQKLRALRIWDGCGGGLFCPDQPLNRVQVAAILMRAFFDAPRPNGQCTASCTGHPCGGGDGCGTTCDGGSGCVVPPPAGTDRTPPSGLRNQRDRLLAGLAARQGTTACAMWNAWTPVQKSVFLTITDLLGKRSFLANDNYRIYAVGNPCSPPGTDCTAACRVMSEPAGGYCTYVNGDVCVERGDCVRADEPRADFETALEHVTTVYGVVGNDCPPYAPGCSCGGGDNHRLYFSADERLTGAIRNFGYGLPLWDRSNDAAGAHAPFNNTAQTQNTSWSFPWDAPTGQIHFWRYDWDARYMTRPGAMGVYDPRLVEIDIDYDTAHPSNPECRDYRSRYERGFQYYGHQGPAELDYAPPCAGPRACSCSGRSCGDPDGCGGVCCLGSGCRPAASCSSCMQLDACGVSCVPRPEGVYCPGGRCRAAACMPSAVCGDHRCDAGEDLSCRSDCCTPSCTRECGGGPDGCGSSCPLRDGVPCSGGAGTCAGGSCRITAPSGPRIDGISSATTGGAIYVTDVIAIAGSGFGAAGNIVELSGSFGTRYDGWWSTSWAESPTRISFRLDDSVDAGPVSARVWNGSTWSSARSFDVMP